MRALMRFIDEMPAAAVRVPTFNLAFLQRFAAYERGEVPRVCGVETAPQGVYVEDGPRVSRKRRWMPRRNGCAARMSALRGNTDESWSRTLDWLVRNRLLAPGYGLQR
jgi:hypothetical protein